MSEEPMWPPGPDGRPVRAILFDVDGTLYRQGPLRRYMLLALVRAALTRPVATLRDARAIAAYRAAQETIRASGGPSADLAGEHVRASAQRSGLPAEAVAAAVDRWMERAPLPALARLARPGLRELLTQAQEAGIALGVVSDYPARAKLDALGVAGCFAAVVSAQDPDVGAFKPSPAGILVALNRLGAAPEDTLYVGDRADVDAAAARAAGVRPVIVGSATDRGAGAIRDFGQLQAQLWRRAR